MNNLFLLIFLVVAVIYACDCAATEGYCHRVKRSANVENVTKTAANVSTSLNDKETKKIENATDTSKNADEDIATKIRSLRSAIEKLRFRLPATKYVRHMTLNKSDPTNVHKMRRSMEKDHCTELKRPKSFFFSEGKHHHKRFGRSFLVKGNGGKKSKRNAAKLTIYHLKMHKDTKDHKFKRSENESPIENFMRLTKMLVDMSENMRSVEPTVHAHKSDAEIILPNVAGSGGSSDGGGIERLSEVIYKPMIVHSTTGDDVAVVSSNEYLRSEFNGLPQPQHAILPLEGAGYHEFAFPLISNFSPLKLLTNAIETEMSLSSSLSSDNDENDSDEYEMTCPVHLKRRADNGGLKDGIGPTGGIMELCTCHLYRKKKVI